MKATINREEFKKAIQSACTTASALSKTHSIPPWVSLAVRRDRLNILASDHELIFKDKIEVKDQNPGRIVVDAPKLKRVIEGLVGREIEMEHDPKTDMLTLKTGESVSYVPPIELGFPLPKIKKLKTFFSLSKKDFKEVVSKCYFAIGENDSRKSLTGLHIRADKDDIVFTAADAYRIVEYRLHQFKHKIEGGAILPKTSIRKIKEIFSKSEELQFAFDDDCLVVSSGKRIFQTTVIQAEYPNLDGLLGIDEKSKITLDIREVKNAARLLKLTVNHDRNAVAKMTLESQKLKVENQRLFPDPVSEICIPCDYEGQSMVLGFNVNFFNEAMQNLKGKGEVDFYIEDRKSPIVFADPENSKFKSVLMPVKVQW